jgi:hypothetical protein
MSATHASYFFVPAGMPHFLQSVRLSKGHFGISLVFQRGPGSGRGLCVPPDEGEQTENADGQHFP